MILVIVGHVMDREPAEQICKGIIFSFHVPIFFILSVLTFQLSTTGEQFLSKTEKAFKHLVIPVLFLHFLKVVIELYQEICVYMHKINWVSFLAEKLNILVYSSGMEVKLQTTNILAIGAIWFCVALFLGRSIFDYLHLKIKEEKYFVTVITICAISGVFIGSKIQGLPLNLDIALACMPFFYFGYYLKGYNVTEKIKTTTITFFIIWVLGISISYYFIFYIGNNPLFYLDFAERNYPLFPLFYITAIAGTMFVSNCSVILTNKWKRYVYPLLYIGKNSLWVLCIHDMDYLCKSVWEITDSNIYNSIIRIFVDFILFFIIMHIIDTIKRYHLKYLKRLLPFWK